MKRISMTVLSVMSLVLMVAGADYSMTVSNDAGESSFNSSNDWEHAQAPAPGNNYSNVGNTLRTPSDGDINNNYTFAGDRLTITSGTFAWKCTGKITIDDLVFTGGLISNWKNNSTGLLYGNIIDFDSIAGRLLD